MAPFMAVALPAAFGGLGALTSTIGAIAQYQQGQYAKTVAGREAAAYDIQAKQVQQEAGQQIEVQDYQASHLLGRLVAGTGASGITSEGSPNVMYNTSADEALLNDMYTRYAANVKSTGLEYQGTLTRAGGAQEAQAATYGAITQGITGPISSGIEAYSLATKTGYPSYGDWSDRLGGRFGGTA